MRTAKISCLLATPAFIVGCGCLGSGLVFFGGFPHCMVLVSEQPIFNDEDVVFEPGLVGTWVIDVDQKSTLTSVYQRAEENAYTVTWTHQDNSGVNTIHLVRLGGNLFFDEFLEIDRLLDPGHLITRATIGDDTLEMALFDYQWLAELVEQGEVQIAHVRSEDSGCMVLTASTEEIQELLLKYGGDDNAFTFFSTFHRLQEGGGD